MTAPPTTADAPLPAGTLLEQADRVAHLAREVRGATQTAEQRSRFTQRLDSIRALTERIAPLLAVQRRLAEAGIPVEPPPLDGAGYRLVADLAAAARQAFEADAESILRAETDVRTLRDKVNGVAAGLEQRLLAAWHAYVDATVPEPDPQRLETFQKIPLFREPVRRLHALAERRRAVRSALPASDEALALPGDLARDLDQAWDDLGGDAPAPVIDLLQGAGSRAGAPLDALTPEAVEWLDARDLTRHLRIRLDA